MMRAMAVGILLAAALAAQPVQPVQPAEVVYLPTPAPPNTFLFSKPGTLVAPFATTTSCGCGRCRNASRCASSISPAA